jgi:hypothetical protein
VAAVCQIWSSIVPRLRACEPYFGVGRVESADRSCRFLDCGGSGDCPRARATVPFLHPSLSFAPAIPPRFLHARCSSNTHPSHVVYITIRRLATSRSLGVVLPSLSPITLRKAGSFRPTMTTPSLDQPSTTAQNIPQANAPVPQTASGHDTLSSSAVEMETLQSPTGAPAPTTSTATGSGAPQIAPVEFTNIGEISQSDSTQPAASSSAAAPARNELNRTETEAALGPSTDGPAARPDNSNGPTLVIMLLLTTGARHPYKIDEKYLKKRNMQVEEMNPYNLSVYNLKELIWRDWREGTFRHLLVDSRHSPVLLKLFAAVLSKSCQQSRYRMRIGTTLEYSAAIPAHSHAASPASRRASLT